MDGYLHAPGAGQSAKPDKMLRSKVPKESTIVNWDHFIARWHAYTSASRIAYQDATLKLLDCCEDSLRQDLRHSQSNIATTTEIDDLEMSKSQDVKGADSMVGSMTLMTKTQNREEDVRKFAARLQF